MTFADGTARPPIYNVETTPSDVNGWRYLEQRHQAMTVATERQPEFDLSRAAIALRLSRDTLSALQRRLEKAAAASDMTPMMMRDTLEELAYVTDRLTFSQDKLQQAERGCIRREKQRLPARHP